MRKIVFTFILAFFSFFAFAQTQKTTIFCTVEASTGKVYYYLMYRSKSALDNLLPDSVKVNVLVDPKKIYNFKNGDETTLWMAQQGWKLIEEIHDAGDYLYILSKEISLDAPAHALFMQKLENVEAKPKE